jgi:lysophospholipase L1-like esterase
MAQMKETSDAIEKASRRKRSLVALLALLVFCRAELFALPGNIQKANEATGFVAIEDPDGAMLNFYEALKNASAGRGVARVIHYGDSHVAADLLTASLRSRLQQRFGDAGTGFVLGGKPWNWYRRGAVESTASDGWKVEGLGQSALSGGGKFGLAGVRLTTLRKDERLSLQSACSRFDVYLMKQPFGGAIDVLLDGARIYQGVSLNSERVEPFYLEVEAHSNGLHSLEIRTTRQGLVTVFGAAIENQQAGVVYDALGINGARLYRMLDWDWQILANNIEHRDPNLIIIAYGSNEVSDKDLDLNAYGVALSTLLAKLHEAAPEAALLVMAPPDRAVLENGKWKPLARMPALVAVQRRAALDSGAAFWNLFQAMGGAGSIDRWRWLSLAQADRVHLTASGYKRAAEMLYAELMRGYLAATHNEKAKREKE